jgi:hypothetical protein
MNSLELRKAIRNKYAWPGGYEMYGVTSDGSVLCCECMRQEYPQIAYARRHNLSDGWKVEGIDLTCNDEDIVTCDHCSRIIFDPNA